MDLQAVIVFVGGFAFCAVVGYIVSVFGAKEQVSSLFVVHRPLFVNILGRHFLNQTLFLFQP